MNKKTNHSGLNNALNFFIVDTLYGKHVCLFFYGTEIPEGYFAYKSKHDPLSFIHPQDEWYEGCNGARKST